MHVNSESEQAHSVAEMLACPLMSNKIRHQFAGITCLFVQIVVTCKELTNEHILPDNCLKNAMKLKFYKKHM